MNISFQTVTDNAPNNVSPFRADDASIVSKGSADEDLSKLSQDFEPFDDDIVIDKMEIDDDSLDQLLQALTDGEDEFSDSGEPQTKATACVKEEQITANINSHMQNGATPSLGNKDVSVLMKGALMEPPKLRPVTPNVVQPKSALSESEFLGRMIGWLHILETPEIVHHANYIFRECHLKHRSGDEQFKNLFHSIFDRLIRLLGTAKFNNIYHRSQFYSPRHHYASTAVGSTVAPNDDKIPLAIAYGIHLARSSNASESFSEQQVKQACVNLNSMSVHEREMFFKFMTSSPVKSEVPVKQEKGAK